MIARPTTKSDEQQTSALAELFPMARNFGVAA
jgi:hypothetical protein